MEYLVVLDRVLSAVLPRVERRRARPRHRLLEYHNLEVVDVGIRMIGPSRRNGRAAVLRPRSNCVPALFQDRAMANLACYILWLLLRRKVVAVLIYGRLAFGAALGRPAGELIASWLTSRV